MEVNFCLSDVVYQSHTLEPGLEEGLVSERLVTGSLFIEPVQV